MGNLQVDCVCVSGGSREPGDVLCTNLKNTSGKCNENVKTQQRGKIHSEILWKWKLPTWGIIGRICCEGRKKNENEINDLGITLTYLWEFFIILIQFRLANGKHPAGKEQRRKKSVYREGKMKKKQLKIIEMKN